MKVVMVKVQVVAIVLEVAVVTIEKGFAVLVEVMAMSKVNVVVVQV